MMNEAKCVKMNAERRAAASTGHDTNIREYLREIRFKYRYVQVLVTRKDRYRELAMRATGRTDAIRVSGTGDRSKVEKYILELWDVHNELQKEISVLMEKSRTAEKLIETLKDDRHRSVLQLRYLCGMTWDDIAERLHFTLRWVHKLHREAIEKLNSAP